MTPPPFSISGGVTGQQNSDIQVHKKIYTSTTDEDGDVYAGDLKEKEIIVLSAIPLRTYPDSYSSYWCLIRGAHFSDVSISFKAISDKMEALSKTQVTFAVYYIKNDV